MTTKLKWLLLSVLGLVLIVIAFYAFFWRHIGVFDQSHLYPDGQVDGAQQIAFIQQYVLPQVSKNQAADTKATTTLPHLVLHWLDVECQCIMLGRLFIEQLTGQNYHHNTRHVVLIPAHQQLLLKQRLTLASDVIVISLSASLHQQSRLFIPATPAASIYSPEHQSLSYLGPHSSGVTCGRGNNFIEMVLNNLSHGFDPKLYELTSEGCFCAW